jgi:squalene-associated FAD-dependent desaturase
MPSVPEPESESAARDTSPRRLAVIGGGLAGLAAAVGLAGRGHEVHLFEARRHWGGRAGSYREHDMSEAIDHCQHVAMGCCTNFLDFCRQTGVLAHFRRDRELQFVGTTGGPTCFAAAPWLPAPLHLAPALVRLPYLDWRDKFGIARAMWSLLRTVPDDPSLADWTVAEWLAAHRQTDQAIRRFWEVVLVSALGETLDRASFSAAHKVFLDGFLAARSAYELWIPHPPLETIYGEIVTWLERQGVTLHAGTRIESLRPVVSQESREAAPGNPTWEMSAGGAGYLMDGVILAVPWRRLEGLWSNNLSLPLPQLDAARSVQSSPITAVHLWFDRPWFDRPHAVIVGRLSQWIFRRGTEPSRQDSSSPPAPPPTDPRHGEVARQATPLGEHYYQVVISASRSLEGRSRDEVREEVLADLRACWPAAREAVLTRWRMVTQAEAVFSYTPELHRRRPDQRTPYPSLAVAGDWTHTGWPSTMEGAVRSGYLAAERLLEPLGQRVSLVRPDLPRGPLTRLLLPGTRSFAHR